MNKQSYPEAGPEGVITGSGLVGFLSVTESLSRGDYDRNPEEGMGLACAVLCWTVSRLRGSRQRQNNMLLSGGGLLRRHLSRNR